MFLCMMLNSHRALASMLNGGRVLSMADGIIIMTTANQIVLWACMNAFG